MVGDKTLEELLRADAWIIRKSANATGKLVGAILAEGSHDRVDRAVVCAERLLFHGEINSCVFVQVEELGHLEIAMSQRSVHEVIGAILGQLGPGLCEADGNIAGGSLAMITLGYFIARVLDEEEKCPHWLCLGWRGEDNLNDLLFGFALGESLGAEPEYKKQKQR